MHLVSKLLKCLLGVLVTLNHYQQDSLLQQPAFAPALMPAHSRSSDSFPYNMGFPGGPPPLQKIQINSVLPALHSICPVLLGTLCPTEGLWSPLTMRDKEANSTIAVFSLFLKCWFKGVIYLRITF